MLLDFKDLNDNNVPTYYIYDLLQINKGSFID